MRQADSAIAALDAPSGDRRGLRDDPANVGNIPVSGQTCPNSTFEDFKPGRVLPNSARARFRARKSSPLRPSSIRSRCISTKRPRATPCSAGCRHRAGTPAGIMMRMMCDGFLLNSSSHGRQRRRRSAMAQAGAAGRPTDPARHRAARRAPRAAAPEMGFVTMLMKCSTRRHAGACALMSLTSLDADRDAAEPSAA